MIASVRRVNETNFTVKSADPSSIVKKVYMVDFGDASRYCCCTCPDFRRNRMLCKHFFAVIDSGLMSFHNITPLFRQHVWTNLDAELFKSN